MTDEATQARIARTREEGRRTFGRCSMFWRDDGTPVDRWYRTAEECRQASAAVDAIVGDLERLQDRCRDVQLGRETGAKFWRHFSMLEETLLRVWDRDAYFAAELDAALERERQTGS